MPSEFFLFFDILVLLPFNLWGMYTAVFTIKKEKAFTTLRFNFFALCLTIFAIICSSGGILLREAETEKKEEDATAIYSHEKSVFFR